MSYSVVKRTVDITISFLALLLLMPFFIVIGIIIKIDSKGPVVFRQRRVGKGKEYFDIIKFRTMKTDTPKEMATHLLENPEQYITKWGRFLRNSSIDEMPQVWNILVGQMSFVGPRPALWNQFDLIEERDKYGANDILPGLTGWAQVNGRDEISIEMKAKLDGEYTRNRGVKMDLLCIAKTVAKILKRDGIVEGKRSSNNKDDFRG